MGAPQRRTGARTRSVGGWNRGQSSVIGVVLLFGLVIAGTGLVVALGTTALTDTQETSNTERATQELTLFDSRAAMVALGDAERQVVQLSGTSGTHTVRDDAGRIIIRVTNTTSGKSDAVYNATLGALEYSNGETTLAYQGGGVWRQDGPNSTTMVSPPEFHYRRATLTLPVIRVTNTDSAGGSIAAEISPNRTTQRVFPNVSATFQDVTDGSGDTVHYQNPIKRQNWTVAVTVKSDYARGWYQYFRERTDGIASYYPGNDTARVRLLTIAGSIGDFNMPAENNALQVEGMAGGHPVTEFDLSLKAEKNGNPFNNMHWSFYSDESDEKFELHFYADGLCSGGGGSLDVSVLYRNTTTGVHEEWQNTAIDTSDYSVDCSSGRLNVDLISSVSQMTYDDISLTGCGGGNQCKWHFGGLIRNNNVPAQTDTFDIHTPTPDNGNYNVGDAEEMDFVVDHYLGILAPETDLTVNDGPGNGRARVEESNSGGTLSYAETTSDEYLTYLHITENEITIDLG